MERILKWLLPKEWDVKKYYVVLAKDFTEIERNPETGEILSITFPRDVLIKESKHTIVE